MNKTTEEADPLASLVKSSDYMQGWKDGRLSVHGIINSIEKETEELLDRVRVLAQIKYQKGVIPLWGIKSGKILLRETFESKNAAWQRVFDLCGDKIDPSESKFKVIKL